VSQVSELRRVLVEEQTRLQAPPGLESRILERALRAHPIAEPAGRRGPIAPAISGSDESRFETGRRSPRVMALIAALLALAVVATLVFTANALHLTHTVPVKPGPVPVTPLPVGGVAIHSVSLRPGGVGGVQIREPIPLKPPATAPCAAQSSRFGCAAPSRPIFVTLNLGWTTDGSAAPEGPTNLYSTEDGGQNWSAQLSWDYTDAAEIKVSPDGMHALIISGWGWQGPALYLTSDAGSHWTSMGFPLSTQQASAVAAAPPQTFCKGTIFCEQDPGYFPTGQIYFLNPEEGWVLSQEPTFSVADLFHTTDSGAHWTLSARFDIKTQFNLDVATGLTYPLPSGKGGVPSVDHQLHGQLVFQSSSAGWLIPDHNFYPSTSLSVFRTLDGGASWKLQTVQAPQGVDSSNLAVASVNFFSDRQGVLEVIRNLSGQGYVYTTSDGGTSWSHPNLIPTDLPGLTDFIDAQQWVAWSSAGRLTRTSDGGQHWSVLAPLPASGFQRGQFDFVDLSHGWAYTGYYLFGTVDGGAHWVKLSLPSSG
jgi:photosystem II stability/assembly factor-like uncharacterized protein